MSELRKLASFISGLSYEEVPKAVLETGKLHILDTVSAAVGAIHNPQLQNAGLLYQELAGEKDAASVWGHSRKVPAVTAAFLNAMAGHILELDDVHTNSKTHIGTVVIPAAWALAEHLKASGRELLVAAVCGYEAMARIGMGFGVASHRNLGWHVTATAGTFGAAAACAKLLGLAEEQVVSALGLAGTQAFGLWAFLGDGANCKALHPARAAASGMEAALLAKCGMTGPEHILDAEDGGLYPATSREYDLSMVSGMLGTRYELLYMDNKPYPCCRSTHCAIDGALALYDQYGVRGDNIESVEVRTYLVGYKQCGSSEKSRYPSTPVEAKFSTPYAVACAFLFGKVSLEHFDPASVNGVEVQKLLRKVSVVPEDTYTQAYPAHWGCSIKVICKDGSVFVRKVKDASGSVANPMTAAQLHAKAASLLGAAFPENAAEVIEGILALDNVPVLPVI